MKAATIGSCGAVWGEISLQPTAATRLMGDLEAGLLFGISSAGANPLWNLDVRIPFQGARLAGRIKPAESVSLFTKSARTTGLTATASLFDSQVQRDTEEIEP